MTAGFPWGDDGTGENRPERDRPLHGADLDAAFAQAISGWVDADAPEPALRDGAVADPQDDPAHGPPGGGREGDGWFAPPPGPYPALPPPAARPPDSSNDRARRRAIRRAEREFELAAFQAEQAEQQARLAADDEHYVPPPPPPIPRPRPRTGMALAMIVFGLVVLVIPGLLTIGSDAAVVVGGVLILGGGGVLLAGLRRHRGDPGDGWDDGAEV